MVASACYQIVFHAKGDSSGAALFSQGRDSASELDESRHWGTPVIKTERRAQSLWCDQVDTAI
jgi:hypothetical protein